MTKVLFVNPPQWIEYDNIRLNFNSGLGLLYLATVLTEEKDIDAHVLDAEALGLTYELVLDYISNYDADIVGITTTTLSYVSMVKLSNMIKEKLNKKIIIGGPHVSALPDKSLSDTRADIAIVGEGENVITEIVNNLKNNETHTPQIVRGDFVDINKYPIPDRELLNPRIGSEYYKGNDPIINTPEAVIVSMRGCSHRCSFCSHPVFGKQKTRRRNVNNIIEEIKLLRDKYKIRTIFFYDDEWIGHSEQQNKWIYELCDQIIENGLDDISYKCQGRSSKRYVKNEIIEKMANAGFKVIMLGCESGSNKVLELNNKGITTDDIRHTVKTIHSYGIYLFTFWMTGMPYATANDEKTTYDLVQELKEYIDQIQVTTCQPLPGSDYYKYCLTNGIALPDFGKEYNQHIALFDTPWQTKESIQHYKRIISNVV